MIGQIRPRRECRLGVPEQRRSRGPAQQRAAATTGRRDDLDVGIEIERRFVPVSPPDVIGPGWPGSRIRQGYLAEDAGVTVRVRITDDWSKLTVKAGRAQARTEVEVDVDRRDAEQLWLLTKGRRIVKTRYRVPLGAEHGADLVAEVDLFEGDLAGLCLVEVEFDSSEAAQAFDPPSWFGRDVTGVSGWSNADLARRGRPPTL